MSVLKRIETTDVFQFLGLILLGIGLFFCYGKGVSLMVVGLLLFLMGFMAGAVKVKK